MLLVWYKVENTLEAFLIEDVSVTPVRPESVSIFARNKSGLDDGNAPPYLTYVRFFVTYVYVFWHIL